jgi:hypothetical protein
MVVLIVHVDRMDYILGGESSLLDEWDGEEEKGRPEMGGAGRRRGEEVVDAGLESKPNPMGARERGKEEGERK